jgi:endonuclease/exonuclease/phosphatase family metal-dependent hydrolase
MKFIYSIIILIFISFTVLAQQSTKLVTWNLCNFGKSKSVEEIRIIANVLKDADIVAIQEVSASDFGAQAVAKLADELNRKGAKWDYVISDPTNGLGKERYAYLWKSSHIKIIGKPWLEKTLDILIDREPFLSKFNINGKTLLLSTIHVVPTSKNPSRECSLLYKLDSIYITDNLMIMGDFNLSQKNKSFDILKSRGFKSSLINQKTSIKMKPQNGEILANEYDNIFFELQLIKINTAGIINFAEKYLDLKEARKISDHLPVYLTFTIL